MDKIHKKNVTDRIQYVSSLNLVGNMVVSG